MWHRARSAVLFTAALAALITADLSGAGERRAALTFAQLSRYVTKGSGGHLALDRGSACDYRKGLSGSKIVNLPGPGECSIATTMTQTPVFGSEREEFPWTWGIFKLLFPVARDPSGRPVGSIFISVTGPVTTVGGKNKQDVIFNARCTRAANRQINWDGIGVDGFKQLCRVNEFVKMG
jgi:hypothetical protein